ncbi:RICIN domain-containing protein [Sphaerisporangium corydalis]|uniref:RICIN domain-containing protein n=1 Tax=Sphaerisporangium corydalis TaxID=1441875 RepID=A0ABV9EUP7_9ACTN|nr:RICIN domain-containing protein [Sphaerisporangium corydalis]
MHRLLVTALTGLALLMSLALTPANAQTTVFPSTLIQINLAGVSKCIGPSNGGTANGTPAVLMDCNELWHGTGRDRSVRSFADKCLSIIAGHPVPTPLGTPLVLRDCTNPVSGDQQWTFAALNPGGFDGIWTLRNPASLRCASPANGSTATGTPLVMQNCPGGRQWLTPNPPTTYGFDEDDGLA